MDGQALAPLSAAVNRQDPAVTIRVIVLLLICAAGIAAAVGGWLFGDHLVMPTASASLTPDEPAAEPRYPVANRDVKMDRVAVAPRAAPVEGLRGSQVIDTAHAWLAAPAPPPPPAPARTEKPSRSFLNDAQIAGIRKRLNLTAAQQKYWPPVESALREVTLQVDDFQRRVKRARDDSFDLNSAALQRLKVASKALYAQLNGTQKNDIVLLARMAGLGPAFAEVTNTRVTPIVEKDD